MVEPLELSRITAEPIQVVGYSFYFDPSTIERGRALGLKGAEFYGLGRAGVLGDVDVDVVDRAFAFFHLRSIHFFWERTRAKADATQTAREYLLAAFAFADQTFGAVPAEVLSLFAGASENVARAVTPGHHLLFDGYRQFERPTDPCHAAYLGVIQLRELRGGAHIDAVAAVGLTPAEACYVHDPGLFAMHGYGDDDVPDVTAQMRDKLAEAEVLTTSTMASYFSVLSGDECQQLANGVLAMSDALASPLAVNG